MLRFAEPVRKIFSPEQPKPPKVPTVAEDEAKAAKAADEARRKAVSALAAQERGGRRSTLFGGTPVQQADIQTRRTLLGGS